MRGGWGVVNNNSSDICLTSCWYKHLSSLRKSVKDIFRKIVKKPRFFQHFRNTIQLQTIFIPGLVREIFEHFCPFSIQEGREGKLQNPNFKLQRKFKFQNFKRRPSLEHWHLKFLFPCQSSLSFLPFLCVSMGSNTTTTM